MPRTCTTFTHPHRNEIDCRLLEGLQSSFTHAKFEILRNGAQLGAS
jgi:hypothetical protein